MENASIFLTTRETIQAIITDFRQYDPQIILFSGIIRLITNNRTHLKREPAKKRCMDQPLRYIPHEMAGWPGTG